MHRLLQSEATQQQRFERGLRQVFDAGGGCMTLTVLTAASSVSIVVNAMNGDAAAKVMLTAADQLLRRISRRSRHNALVCTLCDGHVLWRGEAPGAVGVLTPFNVVPVRTAIGVGICSACVGDRSEAEIAHAAVVRFRPSWLPDLRVMEVQTQAGHA